MGALCSISTAIVVEDQPLIALDIANTLEQAGVRNVETITTVAEALARFDRGDIGLVTMDLILADGAALPMAKTLSERGVPFVYVSGWDMTSDLPPAPWVGKPASAELLIEAAHKAMSWSIAAE
jgi:CheY-like chemotaxis protein